MPQQIKSQSSKLFARNRNLLISRSRKTPTPLKMFGAPDVRELSPQSDEDNLGESIQKHLKKKEMIGESSPYKIQSLGNTPLHMFSAIGPSRSKIAIQAKFIALNRPQSQNSNRPSSHIHRPTPHSLSKLNSQGKMTSSTLQTKPYYKSQSMQLQSKSPTLNKQISISTIKTPQVRKAVTQDLNTNFKHFLRQLSQINTNTNNAPNIPPFKQDLDLSTHSNKKLTSYQTNMPTSVRETNAYLKSVQIDPALLSACQAPNEAERDQLNKFLNNKWITHCIEFKVVIYNIKSLRDQNAFAQQLRYSENLDDEVQNHEYRRKVRRDFHKSLKVSSSRPMMVTTKAPRHLKEYLQLKKCSEGDNLQKQINFYDKAYWSMMKRQDEENLIDFDKCYESKVRKGRFKERVNLMITRSRMYQIPLEEMLNKRINALVAYELKGSYAFIKFSKVGDRNQLALLLQQNPYYVHEFDELQRNALHNAIIKGHLDCVDVLMAYGAKPELQDVYGRTSFYYAIKQNDSHLINTMLQYWAPSDLRYLEAIKLCQSDFVRDLIKEAKLRELINRVERPSLKRYLEHIIN